MNVYANYSCNFRAIFVFFTVAVSTVGSIAGAQGSDQMAMQKFKNQLSQAKFNPCSHVFTPVSAQVVSRDGGYGAVFIRECKYLICNPLQPLVDRKKRFKQSALVEGAISIGSGVLSYFMLRNRDGVVNSDDYWGACGGALLVICVSIAGEAISNLIGAYLMDRAINKKKVVIENDILTNKLLSLNESQSKSVQLGDSDPSCTKYLKKIEDSVGVDPVAVPLYSCGDRISKALAVVKKRSESVVDELVDKGLPAEYMDKVIEEREAVIEEIRTKAEAENKPCAIPEHINGPKQWSWTCFAAAGELKKRIFTPEQDKLAIEKQVEPLVGLELYYGEGTNDQSFLKNHNKVCEVASSTTRSCSVLLGGGEWLSLPYTIKQAYERAMQNYRGKILSDFNVFLAKIGADSVECPTRGNVKEAYREGRLLIHPDKLTSEYCAKLKEAGLWKTDVKELFEKIDLLYKPICKQFELGAIRSDGWLDIPLEMEMTLKNQKQNKQENSVSKNTNANAPASKPLTDVD